MEWASFTYETGPFHSISGYTRDVTPSPLMPTFIAQLCQLIRVQGSESTLRHEEKSLFMIHVKPRLGIHKLRPHEKHCLPILRLELALKSKRQLGYVPTKSPLKLLAGYGLVLRNQLITYPGQRDTINDQYQEY
uniref:Uncharacterized protein n=1 Tax=Timema tahoe TaxID=61484 RepID=A0A7R9IU85_9NEOP|nr:unnamed protein product [Timema tahoe]